MNNDKSLTQKVTEYITAGGRPEYQNWKNEDNATPPPTYSVYEKPLEKETTGYGTFDYYKGDDGIYTRDMSKLVNVKIKDNKVVISAPKEIIDSPFVSQISDELKSLKGADLTSPEVKNAIGNLNNEIHTTVKSAMYGWTPDEYKDYEYAKQTMGVSNPMQSANKIKGKDKEGVIIEKTPSEWIEYWKSNYSADERIDALNKSVQSNNPYEKIMALIMMPTGKKVVYGFDAGERMGQFGAAAGNELMKFPEGSTELLFTKGSERDAVNRIRELGVSEDALQDFSVVDEGTYGARKASLLGKSWDELSEEDKAFLVLVSETIRHDDIKTNIGYGPSGTKLLDAINNIGSANDDTSREAIGIIATYGNSNNANDTKQNELYQSYKNLRNGANVVATYEKINNKDDEQLAKNTAWASNEIALGRMAGVVGRYLWELAVARSLTGGLAGGNGLNLGGISDVLGENIVNKLAEVGISPASNFGRNVIQFSANLAGTIPEDIIQTSVDNIVTGNEAENKNLLNPEQMSENLKNNLIMMAFFNAARAGINSVKRARMAKALARNAELNETINIEGLATDSDDLVRAMEKGQEPIVENGKVSIIDDDGNRKVLENITEEQADLAKKVMSEADGETPKIKESNVEAETPKVTVEVDGVGGKTRVETEDYFPTSVDDALKIKPEATPAGVKQWHKRALEVATNLFNNRILQSFHDKFGDIRVSDFDWVFYNTKKGLSPEQIVGTVDPTTGRTITQNMIDGMKWWSEQSFVKDLRKASRESLGFEGDFDTLGYLPHTDYDPSSLSFEESMTGNLWKKSTGKSMLDDNGKYKGYGGSFQDRYKTFASNMLWDAKNSEVSAAKLVEESQLEGTNITAEQAMTMADGAKKIQNGVNESGSTKEFADNLLSDTDGDSIDWDKINKKTQEDAKNSGVGQAIHDNWGEMYYGANSAKVTNQRGGIVNSFDTQGNFLKNTQTTDGSLYDNGAADYVYATGNANEFVNRYQKNGGDIREQYAEYLRDRNPGRSEEYIEYRTDKAMEKIGAIKGPMTKAKLTDAISSSMKWEAWGRVKRWIARADYSQFNSSTKKHLDQFLFNHMQMESIKTNPKLVKKLSKALDGLTSLRYRALFYGNLKNALLQTSELNRYFYAFKLGDVAKMAKRLASDGDFRTRVDIYVDSIAPKSNKFDAELYGTYSNIVDNMEVESDGVKFKDLGKKAKETADAIGLGPIEAAENYKNRMMIAALVQEADSKGLSDNEAMRYIRERFERVALAADGDMGRLGMASSPLARNILFLQNFQIRELGMHFYNIKDATGMAKTGFGKAARATGYLTKVFGAKLATTLIFARLGYSATQTMGIDPFGLLDTYNQLDEEDMEPIDYIFKTPFFQGGMTSLIADMYFMARVAYEESNEQNVSDEAEQKLGESSYGLDFGAAFDEMFGNAGKNFIPGATAANRIMQMNEMMDTGWATSTSGNMMYTAPNDALNTVLGYLFGRGATANAQQYNQTYGDNLLQTLGRFNPFRQYGDFDPIDTKNYSDWFKGDENDLQQFNKGRYYFQRERDRIIDEYESAASKKYASPDDIAEAKNNMNTRLENLFSQLERFVDAYEKKNGTITSAMVKQVVNILNTGRNVLGDTEEEREKRSLNENSKALERYSQLGISPVGTYTGPSKDSPDKEVEYQGSPQYRTAIRGYYGTDKEAVEVLKMADEKLKPLRDNLQSRLSYAYTAEDWDTLESLQNEYLKAFDQEVAPIIASYGNSILKSTDVADQLRDMLSTGNKKRSANLIPSDLYAKNKWGKFQSMPYEMVDVSAWSQQRYSSDAYKKPSITSYSTAEDDINEIKRLSSSGASSMARVRALELKARVDNQSRALSKEQLQWLNNFLDNGGNK